MQLPETDAVPHRPDPERSRWAYEVKWDGFRAIVSTETALRIRSPRGWNMTSAPP